MLTAAQYDLAMTFLSDVEDPELLVNIVDLGLIYDLKLDRDVLTINMTLTYAGCPLTDTIEADIAHALRNSDWIPRINWVWIPAWTMARITDEGREQLRALGLNIDAVHASHDDF